MSAPFFRLACVLLPLSLSAGCGGSSEGLVGASGTVTHNGAPLPKGEVSFVDEKGVSAAVAVVRDGQFRLQSSADRPGIAPGTYSVTVSSWVREPGSVDEQGNIVADGVPAIPEKYMNYKTSELKATVAASGNSDIKLDLTGEPTASKKKK